MQNVNFDSYTNVLLKIRERLTDPKNWCGDGRAMNDDGGECLGFTILHMFDHNPHFYYNDFVAEVFGSLLPGDPICVPAWNDSHTHAEVLDLLDTAIHTTLTRHKLSTTASAY